ncbi:unnamed protein product [Rotaria sordida]|uniref:B box-type domain-containing protein n=1 Tax=Rotaria sordida TaxID=392033 RepID=A0A813VUU5_9BILA|nr:unnamed protein product [Rotaria sordida]
MCDESMANDQSVAFQKPLRKCTDCKKPPHMQCLHCSKHVCIDCGQKHVALGIQQIDVAQHVLNDKMNIVDRLSASAKERVDAECTRILKQVDTQRDQAFAQIDQIVAQQKEQIRNKGVTLNELPLDEISSYIQRMTKEMEDPNETNNQLFHIDITLPKIQVRQQLSTARK